MQGTRSRARGIHLRAARARHQSAVGQRALGARSAILKSSRTGVARDDVQGFYTYDAFSPLVLFALERFGYCGIGEAAAFVQNGRIAPGGALPVNTSGGLLSEAHVGGLEFDLRDDAAIARQAGASQIAGRARRCNGAPRGATR